MGDNVKTIFEIEDKITGQLGKIIKASEKLGESYTNAEKAGQKAFNPNGLYAQTKAHQGLGEAAGQSANEQTKWNNQAQTGEGRALSLAANIGKLTVAFFGLKKAGDAVGSAFLFSDKVARNNASLNAANDGLQTTGELYKTIMERATNAGTSFDGMLGTVGRIGTVASGAFESTEQIIDFAEQVGKHMNISNIGAQGQEALLTQLTQGLSKGALQAQELNTVFEQAPTIANALASELGVSTGELKALAAEGQITSDVLIGALENYKDETETLFNNTPWTIGGGWTSAIKNQFYDSFKPMGDALNDFVNTDQFKEVIGGAIELIQKAGEVALIAANAFTMGATWVIDHWDSVSRVIKIAGGVVGGIWIANMLSARNVTMKSLFGMGRGFIGLKIQGITSAVQTAGAWAAANWPFLVIIGAIGALMIYLHKAGVTFEDVAGVAIGAFDAVGAAVGNVFNFIAQGFDMVFMDVFNKIETLLNIAEKVGSLVKGEEVRWDKAHFALDKGRGFLAERFEYRQTQYKGVSESYRRGEDRGRKLARDLTGIKENLSKGLGVAQFGTGVGGDGLAGVLGTGNTKADEAMDGLVDKAAQTADNTANINDNLTAISENLNHLVGASTVRRIQIFNNENRIEIKNDINNPDSSFDIDGLNNAISKALIADLNSGGGGDLAFG